MTSILVGLASHSVLFYNVCFVSSITVPEMFAPSALSQAGKGEGQSRNNGRNAIQRMLLYKWRNGWSI